MSLETFRRLADGLQHIQQAAGDVLDYSMDWSDWLTASETISTSAWSVPAGVTSSGASVSATMTLVFLATPTVGSYSITNTISTSGGRTIARTFVVDVKAKLS